MPPPKCNNITPPHHPRYTCRNLRPGCHQRLNRLRILSLGIADQPHIEQEESPLRLMRSYNERVTRQAFYGMMVHAIILCSRFQDCLSQTTPRHISDVRLRRPVP